MIESEEIKNNYLRLLYFVEMDAKVNAENLEYYKYLNEYKNQFIDISNIHIKEKSKEFLRSANRYSDEFEFSDEYYSQIREVTNKLYNILNN